MTLDSGHGRSAHRPRRRPGGRAPGGGRHGAPGAARRAGHPARWPASAGVPAASIRPATPSSWSWPTSSLSAALLAWAARTSLTLLMGVALFGYIARLALVTVAVLAISGQSWFSPIPLCATIVRHPPRAADLGDQVRVGDARLPGSQAGPAARRAAASRKEAERWRSSPR